MGIRHRAWRRTGLALDRIGLLVTDRDRSQGIYYIRPAQSEMDKSDESGGFWSSLLFWRSQDSQAGKKVALSGGDYQVRVKAVNDSSSQVVVLDKSGQPLPASVSQSMLARLQQELQ